MLTGVVNQPLGLTSFGGPVAHLGYFHEEYVRRRQWAGSRLALTAIFLPSFLLIMGVLPFWNSLRTKPTFQAALTGINTAVVGLLLPLYKPVWTSAIISPADFGLGLVAFTTLIFWKVPPWVVVVLTALGGELLSHL